jgi:hypothetical protein
MTVHNVGAPERVTRRGPKSRRLGNSDLTRLRTNVHQNMILCVHFVRGGRGLFQDAGF